jgi:hypothetical protein
MVCGLADLSHLTLTVYAYRHTSSRRELPSPETGPTIGAMSVGFSKRPDHRAIPEHPLWTLQKGKRTAEARTRMTPLGPELRIYYNGELLRSEIPRDGREVGALAEEARQAWIARGWMAVPRSVQRPTAVEH